jgi:uncharacterized membrane protein YdjX (TVP38/TMEM64 family)
MSARAFSVATFLGMLPLTVVYNYFGSVVVVSGRLTLAVGLGMVLFFFAFPVLIERYDLFSLRKFFQHVE